MNHPSRPLTSLLALGLIAAGPESDRDDYAGFALAARGDSARGRAVFADPTGVGVGCIRCHRVGGDGGDVGPDLSDVGGELGREHLIESVLEPSRQIVEGNRPTVVATTEGRVLSGLVKGETAEELTLVDSDARPHTVDKARIEERKFADISLMPEGLSALLSRQQFVDLIAYLEGRRAAGKSSPGSGITGPIDLPGGFAWSKVVVGLTGATALAISPDGRVFLCEQTGAVHVVKEDVLQPEPFVTLEVDPSWERGLIGVTLDPDFSRNGRIYLTYVRAEPYPHHRISRFTARGDVALPGSEAVLLEGDDQRTMAGKIPAGHQGGALHFGVDGKLYVAIGDQTAGAPAQRLDTFLGKLLRINPDDSIPEDNPSFATARGKYRAIWALGLRNPFTFAVQPVTGRIFLNGVGQNAWEEIDEGFPGPTTAGPPPKVRPPTPDSAARSMPARIPRSRARRSVPTDPPPRSPPNTAASTSSWTSPRTGSRSSIPTARRT